VAAAQQPGEEAERPLSRPAEVEALKERLRRGRLREERIRGKRLREKSRWRTHVREDPVLLGAASSLRQKQSTANLVTRAAAGLSGVGNGSSSSIADVDGDGNLDLLTTGADANGNETATLYLGDGQGGFSEANAGLTGVWPSSSSIADVNGDGNPDLLITGAPASGDPVATLYLGDGQGNFTEANAGLTGVYRSSTSIADVDGDGNQDLLTTGADANGDETATLYLGDGQGGFSEANAGLTGVQRSSTSIADVNGDENPDLLITGSGTATLYLGDGQGDFSEANAGLTGVDRSSSSIADVDGDGNPDLLITGSGTATLYLGDGQEGFSEAEAGLTGVDEGSTSIADVDGDGNNDLLITGGNTATLYLGDGQGSFSEAEAGLTGVDEGSTSIADLYGDGDLDLFITGDDALFFGPSARIYVNRQNQSPPNRAPTFARAFSYDRPLAPGVTLSRTVEAGDLDGDLLSIQAPSNPNASVNDAGNGIAEVTFTPGRNQGGDVANVTVEASDPDGAIGSFTALVEVSPVMAAFSTDLTGVQPSSSSIADVDGDGNQDLLIAGNAGTAVSPDPTATLYLGDGQGGFTEAGADLSGVFRPSTSIADVDGDGNPDLLITGSGTAPLYLGDGQGGFNEANAGLAGVFSSSTSIADVDGDGNLDLLITGADADFNPTATLYLGDGQGGFSEANADLTGVGLSSTSIADVDGDGNLDLLITGADADFNPTATLYLGDGQGGFNEANAGLAGVFSNSTSIADVDGDGNEDLLIVGFGGNGRTATLYLGDGQGDFSEANAGLAGTTGSTSIADTDGDTDPDLLIAGFSAASRSRSSVLYENLFDDPLPVELASLDARANGQEVRLTWQTVSETNNAGFEVQRKAGQQGAWTRVGSVEGAGTTTEAQSYRFTDGDLPYEADALTYRLRQVDTDGSVNFSETVTVKRGVDEVEILGTYPNPARGQATVRYALPERRNVSVRLYDALGREVRTLIRAEQKGRHERQVDLSSLASGAYFLRLRAGEQTRTQRLTVVR